MVSAPGAGVHVGHEVVGDRRSGVLTPTPHAWQPRHWRHAGHGGHAGAPGRKFKAARQVGGPTGFAAPLHSCPQRTKTAADHTRTPRSPRTTQVLKRPARRCTHACNQCNARQPGRQAEWVPRDGEGAACHAGCTERMSNSTRRRRAQHAAPSTSTHLHWRAVARARPSTPHKHAHAPFPARWQKRLFRSQQTLPHPSRTSWRPMAAWWSSMSARRPGSTLPAPVSSHRSCDRSCAGLMWGVVRGVCAGKHACGGGIVGMRAWDSGLGVVLARARERRRRVWGRVSRSEVARPPGQCFPCVCCLKRLAGHGQRATRSSQRRRRGRLACAGVLAAAHTAAGQPNSVCACASLRRTPRAFVRACCWPLIVHCTEMRRLSTTCRHATLRRAQLHTHTHMSAASLQPNTQ
jgi:hypothetical protein